MAICWPGCKLFAALASKNMKKPILKPILDPKCSWVQMSLVGSLFRKTIMKKAKFFDTNQ
jgi:hypothetical protein